MKTKILIIALATVCTLGLVAQQQRSTPARSSGPIQPDPSIVSKLSEIVSIRERLAKNYQQMLAAGRASAGGLAEVELAEARIELARERGQRDAILTELKGLVAAHERRVKRIEGVAIDRGPVDHVDRARAALLEAEVRLMKAQK